ncbi:MAG: nucleoside triphosphate pyrophosphohydrolase [Oscillospiraceae bacterium]
MEFELKARYDIGDLVEIIAVLRAPNGCPWDREQTHASIRKNLIEETYEVAEAIDTNDTGLLLEELGDLLMQVLMHAQMEAEQGHFTFDDVCNEVSQKLVYRHPHVFGDVTANDSDTVLRNWEDLKNAEKGRQTAADRLESVPAGLPALMRSQKVQKRAADFGFSYADTAEAMIDLRSEVEELQQALQLQQGVEHEAGDVLFAAVNVARQAGIDAEEALTRSCNRFVQRVEFAEEQAQQEGQPLQQASRAQLDGFWKSAKQRQKNL